MKKVLIANRARSLPRHAQLPCAQLENRRGLFGWTPRRCTCRRRMRRRRSGRRRSRVTSSSTISWRRPRRREPMPCIPATASAENSGFAKAVARAGLTWIGPTPESIDDMGDKEQARLLARAPACDLAGQCGAFRGRRISPASTRRRGPWVSRLLVKASAGAAASACRGSDRAEIWEDRSRRRRRWRRIVR